MKFIHIADVHLGAEPEGRSGRELWESLERVIDLCEEEQQDLLLIAGDLFHRQPLLRELREVNYLFSKLSHTEVVVIAGNHDYIRKDSFYCSFEWGKRIHFITSEEPECVTISSLKTGIYGFSYHSREIRESRYEQMMAPGAYPVEILLAHGGDEKHIPLRGQRIADLGYDYVALGHIHKPQMFSGKKAAFSGALEPLDINDTGVHGFIRGEINEQGTKVVFVPFASRSYLKMPIEVDTETTNAKLRDQIRAHVRDLGTENLYRVVLQGFRSPEMEFDTEELLRNKNVLRVEDDTEPSYQYEKLARENCDNLLGKYILHFLQEQNEADEVKQQALYEGVRALLGD